jgi:hypothetical protein
LEKAGWGRVRAIRQAGGLQSKAAAIP